MLSAPILLLGGYVPYLLSELIYLFVFWPGEFHGVKHYFWDKPTLCGDLLKL